MTTRTSEWYCPKKILLSSWRGENIDLEKVYTDFKKYQERMRLLIASGAGLVYLLIRGLQHGQPPATVSDICPNRSKKPAMIDRESVRLCGSIHLFSLSTQISWSACTFKQMFDTTQKVGALYWKHKLLSVSDCRSTCMKPGPAVPFTVVTKVETMPVDNKVEATHLQISGKPADQDTSFWDRLGPSSLWPLVWSVLSSPM